MNISNIDVVESWAAILLIVCFGLLIILILREFWCWYFKINERISLLKGILKALTENDAPIPDEIFSDSFNAGGTKHKNSNKFSSVKKICANCNKSIDVNADVCDYCGE